MTVKSEEDLIDLHKYLENPDPEDVIEKDVDIDDIAD